MNDIIIESNGSLIYNGSSIPKNKKVLINIPDKKKFVFKRKDDFGLVDQNQGKKILKDLHKMVEGW